MRAERIRKFFAVIAAFLMIGLVVTWPTIVRAAELSPIGTNGATLAATTKTTVAATSKAPYTDVTVKSVGKNAYEAIKYLKAHKAFRNLFTGKKFYPNKAITRREFLLVLKNLYGSSKVPVTYTDLKNANKPVTAKYACDKMVVVAKKLGIKMKWNGSKSIKLTRASMAVYIKIFIDFDKALRPK